MAGGVIKVHQFADNEASIEIVLGTSQTASPIRVVDVNGNILAQINSIGNFNVAQVTQKQQQPTTNVVMAASDVNFFVDTSAGNVQVTIVNPGATSTSGALGRLSRMIRVFKTTANANTVTVLVAAGGNINGGGTSYVLTTVGQSIELISMPLSDSTGAWFISSTTHPILGVKTITSTPYVPLYHDHIVLVDATAGAFAVNLPSASGIVGVGHPIQFIKADASANAVTINRNGADTIEGAASIALAAQYDKAALLSNGTSLWYRVSNE